MRVTIDLRRPARRSVALLVSALLLAVPAVVVANHQFPDVTNSTPFHNEIGAIANAGITAGFPDGKFHPASNVTRQSMAAFMHRGFGRVGLAYWTTPIAGSFYVDANAQWSPGWTAVRQLTMTVPGATNTFSPNQLVHVQGRVTLQGAFDESYTGCPCEMTARIVEVQTGTYSGAQYQTFHSSYTGTGYYYSLDVEGVFVAPPGSRTYQLEVALNYRRSSTNGSTFTIHQASSVSAMTFPFGPTGSDTLAKPEHVESAINVGKPVGSVMR